ncbi:hypothetical protein [Kribbella sp. NPDC048928]|uniref:hypothetical protein n=1 Tax=Kribbella sp. NPDC048928 TaxID=3364111 RepID=UPI003710E9DB
MNWRPAVTIAAVLALVLNACDRDDPKKIDGEAVVIFAGGGASTLAKRAVDLSLSGVADDLEVGRDDVVRLMVTEHNRVLIWAFGPDGSVGRTEVDPKITDAAQMAVADDGTVYISHLVGRVWAISEVGARGQLTPIIIDGLPATSKGIQNVRPIVRIDGIAVDRLGRLVFVEDSYNVARRQAINLVRRVEANGQIVTIAGRDAPLGASEYAEAIIRSVAPPSGTRAIDWPLPGLGDLDSLAVGDDNTIYVQAHRGVLALPPDGTIRPVARRRDRTAAHVADRPFTHEGDAADADPRFIEHAGITEDHGFVAMPVTQARPDYSNLLPAAFRWTGDFTPNQRMIIEAAQRQAGKTRLQQILRIVRPDGSITTGAWAIDGAALRGGVLYVLIQGDRSQLMIGKIDLPD